MKNTPLHIEENELDQLLRQFVLDGGDDEFTQNTMTMNAEIIFSNAATVTPNAARESAMLRKLEEAFVKRRGFGKFWLNGIIFLLFISAAVWFYKINSGKETASSHHPGNNSSSFSPVIYNDTSVADEKNTAQIISSNTSFEISTNDSVAADTLQNQNVKEKKEHFVTPDTHIRIEKNWYEGKEAEERVEIPGPVFTAKASPENYKTAQGEFKSFASNTETIMFGYKQDSFAATYYIGAPFKSGMNDMQYFNYGEYVQTVENNNWGLPVAILNYADPDEVKVETVSQKWGKETRNNTYMFMYKIPEKGIQLAIQPFYFRKYEVTNKEYREFVNWVRASNGYADKAITSFTVDTVEVTDPKDNSGEQLTIKGKKFRLIRKATPIEDYKEVFNYVFFNANAEGIKSLKKNAVYVFPDTTSWTNDFSSSYNEPMTNMYFWHPAYDNYPVVGVSWYQAMAFLDWKTHMHQKQLDAEKIPYEIEYILPSDIEWEIASIAFEENKKIAFDQRAVITTDWLTNLALSWPGHDDPYQRPNYLKNLFTKDEYYRGNFIRDGYFHTGPADLSHGKNKDDETETKHLDPLGVSWMDGNVSEWMMESYAENWKPFFDKHLAVLDADTSESTQLAKQIEMLYDKGNAQNGRLVRGANWYDERFSGRPGSLRNEAGINPKRFVDPSEQHSTVGFRYVIHVRKK
jgi:formylglycine-generating enzyme required for sulfatase activity